MVSLLIDGDNNAADTSPALSPVALADDRLSEMELDNDRRATLVDANSFDPSGLYALELERDLAASLLAETVKGDVTLSRTSNVHHVSGQWLHSTEWLALIFLPTAPSLRSIAPTPTEAVNGVLEQWRKLNAPVRARPEARGLTAESFEAFAKVKRDAAKAAKLAEQPEPETEIRITKVGWSWLAEARIVGGRWVYVGTSVNQRTATLNAQAVAAGLVKESSHPNPAA